MERIGIYGGTFNPPHAGHIQAAKQAVTALNLDKLVIVPTSIAPHKAIPEHSPTPRQRLEMLRIAAADCPKAEVSDIELNRGGISYTFQTVSELKERYPDAELILLMGSDMFLCFDQWKQPDDILKNVELGVFYRGSKGEKTAVAESKAKLEQRGRRFVWWKTTLSIFPPPSCGGCWRSTARGRFCPPAWRRTFGNTGCTM